MNLTLLQPPPCPVQAGDVVTIVETLTQPSGRTVYRGDVVVLAVEDTPPEHAHLGRYRLAVEARRADWRGQGSHLARLWLYPGEFSRIVDADPIPHR